MANFQNMRSDSEGLLRNLFDVQFTTVVTTRMVPAIYSMALILSALATLYGIVWAFDSSWLLGAVWLLLIGPAIFLGLITTVRVLLEFVLTVFRIAVALESVGGQVDSIAGQTDEIAEDLPRIRFWKTRRK